MVWITSCKECIWTLSSLERGQWEDVAARQRAVAKEVYNTEVWDMKQGNSELVINLNVKTSIGMLFFLQEDDQGIYDFVLGA